MFSIVKTVLSEY